MSTETTPGIVTIHDENGRLRVELPAGHGAHHRYPVAGQLIQGWADTVNEVRAENERLKDGMTMLTLVPVEVFGAEVEGYGLCDAVQAWSDCNRAEGKIYRVDDIGPGRIPGETVQILVRTDQLAFFEKRWGDDPEATAVRTSELEMLRAESATRESRA